MGYICGKNWLCLEGEMEGGWSQEVTEKVSPLKMSRSLLDAKGDSVDEGRRIEEGLPGEQSSINKGKDK